MTIPDQISSAILLEVEIMHGLLCRCWKMTCWKHPAAQSLEHHCSGTSSSSLTLILHGWWHGIHILFCPSPLHMVGILLNGITLKN